MDHALAWTNQDVILVAHLERYSYADVVGALCEGSGIFSIDLETGVVHAISTAAPMCDAVDERDGPSVAPDGQWAVYSARTPQHGKRLVKSYLTKHREDTVKTTCVGDFEHPAVSADGRWIAGNGYCSNWHEGSNLLLMRSDGSDVQQIHIGDSIFVHTPTWDPTGRYVAFEENENRPTAPSIAIWDVRRRTHRRLVLGTDPSWSPDGEWIAFSVVSDRLPRNWELWLIRPDGSGKHVVFRNTESNTFSRGWGPSFEGTPTGPVVWSPDSRQIAFTRRYDAGSPLWRLDVATGAVTPITKPSQEQRPH